jgi:hypothetical protein
MSRVCVQIDYPPGKAETNADVRRRGKWKTSEGDALYQAMVDAAIKLGVEPVEA